MLKTRAGGTIGTGPYLAQADAQSIEETAKATGLGRSTIYKAINLDPTKRDGLPFLPSMKVGKRRLIRAEARREWLRQLEDLERIKAEQAA